MGGIGSDIAVEAADIVLINDELKGLPHLFAIFNIICDENKLKLLAKGILLDKFPIFFYNKYSNKTKDFIYLCTYKNLKIKTLSSNNRGMMNI